LSADHAFQPQAIACTQPFTSMFTDVHANAAHRDGCRSAGYPSQSTHMHACAAVFFTITGIYVAVVRVGVAH